MRTVVLLACLLAATVALGGCLSGGQINDEIKKANYCSVDSDCVMEIFGCPFGCGSYVNKAELDRLEKLVSDYHSAQPLACVYGCVSPPSKPACREGVCVASICELNREYAERECECPAGSTGKIYEKFKCVIREDNSEKIPRLCEADREFSEKIRTARGCADRGEPECFDGWSSTSYYDTMLAGRVQTEEEKQSVEIPEELANAIMATQSTSTCSCESPVSYYLSLNGTGQKQTDCETFYSTVEDYNFSCDGCLMEWKTSCC
ncbi:hypothetical protein KKH30_03760 [Candidatus Micrarchaeota archaeon]|nr:hypothetical protein [Candidatus Micrarchaeota archaeon]